MLLESCSDLTSSGRISVGIVADKCTVFVVLSVFELCNNGGNQKTGHFIEGETCFNGTCTCIKSALANTQLVYQSCVPLSMTIALSEGVAALLTYPSGCGGCQPLKGNSGAGYIFGLDSAWPSSGGVGRRRSVTIRVEEEMVMVEFGTINSRC